MTAAAPTCTPLVVQNLGVCSYADTWKLQKELQQALIRGEGQDTLLLCEHRAVITTGTSTKEESLLSPPEKLSQHQIEFFDIERGGDITYHGPGQLVGYPIINLSNKRRDVHWYMRGIEEAIIRSLTHFGLHSERIAGRTGVWTQGLDPSQHTPARKIASIGVRISRWCSMHGFALNVLDQTAGFSHILPCGFNDIIVTSMEQERGWQGLARQQSFSVAEVAPVIVSNFCEVFGFLAFESTGTPADLPRGQTDRN
ncbi:MAG: lipoyl(octanoyl) transferase LipB [Proteobacteria bacterium]|nr:lipoyl(octanoyl) transferase LipB [Pseudomonadota bacterium]